MRRGFNRGNFDDRQQDAALRAPERHAARIRAAGMKLATLRAEGRDGRLVVVSNDLTRCVDASRVAPTLQAALEDWDNAAPELAAIARGLEVGGEPVERFHERDALSPLPRAYAWLDGSAYVNHVALARKARGAPMPDLLWSEPLMYQGGSDSFLAPREAIHVADPAWGVDVEGEIAVIVGDVPMGATEAQAAAAIRLVMLVNDVSLRGLIPGELSKGFGFLQSKPSSAFSPVAVTPDSLGDAWDGRKLHLPLSVDLNGAPLGRAEAGEEMTFDFPRLIVHAARTRRLVAGTIIGSGTVSNIGGAGGHGAPVSEGGRGYSCIVELRMVETERHGGPRTPFLRYGDTVRIEMRDRAGKSIFGAIEQRVEPGRGPD